MYMCVCDKKISMSFKVDVYLNVIWLKFKNFRVGGMHLETINSINVGNKKQGFFPLNYILGVLKR